MYTGTIAQDIGRINVSERHPPVNARQSGRVVADTYNVSILIDTNLVHVFMYDVTDVAAFRCLHILID